MTQTRLIPRRARVRPGGSSRRSLIARWIADAKTISPGRSTAIPPAIRPGDQCSRTTRRRTSPAPRSPSRIPGRTQETLRDSRPRWAVDARWHRPELTANEFPAISLLTVASSPPAAPAIPPQPPAPQQHDFLALGQGKAGVPAHGTSRYPVAVSKHHRTGNPWAHIIHKRCTSNEKSRN